MINIEFEKIESDKIAVSLNIDGGKIQFSYIEMIKYLIKDKKMGEPKVSGEFSDAEVNSIKSMIGYINKEIAGQAK